MSLTWRCQQHLVRCCVSQRKILSPLCVCVWKQLFGTYFQVWKRHFCFVLRNVKFFQPCGNWMCNFSLPHIMRNHVLAICPMQLILVVNYLQRTQFFIMINLCIYMQNIQEISIKWCLVLCSFSSSLGHIIPNLKVYFKSLELQPKAQK
jgi:hypothetical protein